MKKVIIATISLLAILSALVYVGIPVPLGALEHRLERLAGSVLDREVRIDGPSKLIISLHPSLTIGGLVVGNPPHWLDEEPLLQARSGKARIDLLALLRGQIRIETLELERVALRLITRTDHLTNFVFTSAQRSSGKDQRVHEFAGLDSVKLSDIEISYRDELSGTHYILTIEEAHGRGKPETPLQLQASGTFASVPYSLDIEGGPLVDLLRGGGSWPLTGGRLMIGDVMLEAGGTLIPYRMGEGAFLSVALEGQNLPDLAALFDVTIPDPGAFSLSTHIGLAPGFLHFTDLALEAAPGLVAGDLAVSLQGDRPLVGGSLSLSLPALEAHKSASTEGLDSKEARDGRGAEKAQLPWHLLEALDADLVLRVGKISRAGLELSGIRSTVSLVDGELVVPVAMNIHDLHIQGLFAASAGDPQPAVSGKISTSGANLGPLLQKAGHDVSWGGSLGPLQISGSSRGRSVADLLEAMTLSVRLGESALARDEETLVRTEELSFELLAENSVALSVHGELLDSPLDLRARLADSSVDIDLDVCDTSVLVNGRRIDEVVERSEFDLKIEGEKACGLIHPLARFTDLDPGYEAAASGSLSSAGIELAVERARLGDLRARGRLQVQEGENNQPRVTGEIRSPRLDLAHILAGAPEAAPPVSAGRQLQLSDTDQDEYEQSMALLSQILAMETMGLKRFLSTDVQLKIGVEEIVTGLIDVADVELTIEAEEGKLRHSPFQARIGGSLFYGSAALDLRSEVPSAYLDLETHHFSVAQLLEELQIDDLPELSAARVGLEMNFEGSTVKEMLLGAHYRAQLLEGRIKIDRQPLTPLIMDIETAEYVAFPYQPAMMSLNGMVNSLPLHLESTSSGFFARGTDKPVILSLQGNISDCRFEGLYDMGVRIGDSSLWGELILTLFPGEGEQEATQIGLQSRLEARTIQLNDFKFGQWSPLYGKKDQRQDREAAVPVQKASSAAAYDLLSEEVAGKVDAALEIVVQEVLSGQDELGRGYLKAKLEQGTFTLNELQLNIPGGTVQISGKLRPQKKKIAAELLMNIEDFDYGILIRRNQPDSRLKGRMNLLLDLNSEVDRAARLSKNLNGRFRFGVIPEEFKAGALDLWAVNILTAALPVMMKGSSSVVNCLAGDFVLEQSLMQPELFVLDTSNMRVNGKGLINFRTNEIDFVLNPKPKSAQFFSLATPVAVTGSILHPDIGVTTAGIIGTLFRQPLSILTVPLQWLFTDNLDRDGGKVCAAAMQWVKDAGEEEEP
ncbi:MAG: AsmA-like C-terminal region-containing protein [Desulfofustis sp.]